MTAFGLFLGGAAALALFGWLYLTLIGAPLWGGLVGDVIGRLTRYRYGRYLAWAVSLASAIGLLPALFWLPWDVFEPINLLLAYGLGVGALMARLKGVRLWLNC